MGTYTKIVIFIFFNCFHGGISAGAFVTHGLPAGYVSRSSNHALSGLYHYCRGATSPSDGVLYYLYCSDAHSCCSTSSGYPACCVARDSLNRGEVAGIVISCTVFLGVLLGLAIFVSQKYFSNNANIE